MKKNLRKALICLVSIAILILNVNTSMLVYAGPYDTFKISTPEQLFDFARAVNSCVHYPSVELTNDIYVGTDNIWIPIGTLQHPFCGVFDGKGHTITGLGIQSQGNHIGLFGVVGRDSGWVGNVYYDIDSQIYGTVKNVNVAESYFKANSYVGGICGYAYGDIINCNTIEGEVYANNCVGGNVGLYNGYCWKKGKGIKGKEDSILEGCKNTGSVKGKHRVGGNVGWLQADGVGKVGGCTGEVRNCINSGDVCGAKKDIGGNIGKSGEKGRIYSCKNSGCVFGKKNTGLNIGLNNGKATGCTGTGKVIKK